MRLFVGLALSDRVKEELARVITALQPSIPDARWVPRENLHATLSFLGSVADERVPAITEALSDATAGLARGEARLDGLGTFPTPRRARVIWAGLADPAGVLLEAARAVIDAMASVGFPAEDRPFRSHITLARRKAPGPVTFPPDVMVEQLSVTVAAVTLFRSHLGRPSARYEAIASFRFREA